MSPLKHFYEPVGNDLEENVSSGKQWTTSSRLSSLVSVLVPWVLLLGLSGYVFFPRTPLNPLGTYETGFNTDFEPVRSALELQQVRFTGGLKFDENGTLFRDSSPSRPQYVGVPNAEVDGAWKRLLDGRYIGLSEAEALKVDDNAFHNSGLGYLGGVDVLHSLHCVNRVRKGIYSEHYYQKTFLELDYNDRIHLDHCLDHLRQVIQCGMDITPLPAVWSSGAGASIVDFERMHTCRNFESLREWFDSRADERSAAALLSSHDYHIEH